MESPSRSLLIRPTSLLVMWAIVLFTTFIFSIFLHEDGHGLGAKIDKIHISTGFNKVGDYGKSPDDPDFRSSRSEGAFWSGLLGPMTTWMLAMTFTLWLYRLKGKSLGALSIGAFALANGFIRALPMIVFFVFALLGKPYVEDEVGWGIWYVLKYCRPDLAALELNNHTLMQAYPHAFLGDFFFWMPPLISLVVSLACLILAFRRIYQLWGERLNQRVYRLILGILPIFAYLAVWPVLNWLDRLVRINW